MEHTSIMFQTLADAQDLSKIVSVFSHGVSHKQFQSQTPLLIVLAGAPGVGKTSQVKKIIEEQKMDYHTFYNVSLDSLVERVRPYRITTKLLYDEMRKKRGSLVLREEDYATLNEVYMATIRSRDRMFDSTYTVHRILDKLEGKQKKESDTKKTAYFTLNELRKKGLEYGIDHGFNIIYDTTFSSKKNVVAEDIMPLLEKHKIPYRIHIIHITSTEEQILKQLQYRHRQMVKEGYIRAIGPKLTKKFIKENQLGFEIAQQYFVKEYQEKHPSTHYTADRFIFQTVFNEPKPIPMSPSRFSNDDRIEEERPVPRSSKKMKKNNKTMKNISKPRRRSQRKLH